MITRRVRIQLIAFALVTVLAFGYGSVRLFGLGDVIRPGYEVAIASPLPTGSTRAPTSICLARAWVASRT